MLQAMAIFPAPHPIHVLCSMGKFYDAHTEQYGHNDAKILLRRERGGGEASSSATWGLHAHSPARRTVLLQRLP